MNLSGLLTTLQRSDAYQALLDRLAAGESGGPLGLLRAARAYVTAALAEDTGRPLLAISARLDYADTLAEQLLAWNPDLQVLSFPEPNALFYERAPWGPRTTRSRLQVLAQLSNGVQPGTVVVTTARALMQRTLPPDFMRQHRLAVAKGQRLPGNNPDNFLRTLLQIGYEPATVVTEPGTFSRRGGILDVFPMSAHSPVRIELWGDDVESLRTFDPASQRSLVDREQIVISPAREALPVYGLAAATRLRDWFADLPQDDEAMEAGLNPRADQEKLLQQSSFDTLEFYIPWLYDEPGGLVDYLPGDALVLIDDAEELTSTIDDLEEQALSLRDAHLASGTIPSEMPLPYLTHAHLLDALTLRQSLEMGGSPHLPGEGQGAPLGDRFLPGPRFGGELVRLLEHLREMTRSERDRVVVVSRQAERLAEIWAERTLGPRPIPVESLDGDTPSTLPTFVRGGLSEGWQFDDGGRLTGLFTDSEIFGWRRPEPRRRRQPKAIAPEDFFADLQPGDYVVHIEHGIGQFDGLEKRTLGGTEREFLKLQYANGSLMYVPIHQADRIARYVGADDSLPELSKLGTQEWERVKQRTRENVEEVARDLLELYAARETITGHAFNPDTPWQHELEASFPYVETEDQLRALREVKADMERPQPMDRLICGDVGYGKTEVALRASFKAVMAGKQVAILVPTTVLAQQHFDTFSQRLAAFPVEVAMLSRFRTRGEQDEIIAGLAAGTVDVVIGTHRLLSGDVTFKDLGLVVIDEEQRFGVTHKEQLKQLRTEVDVLTLTATPIPRTLYMGLAGVRDISLINTAPEERLPIRTHVGKRDDDLIRQAILRELDRGGQVFFVHNRVKTIHTERARLAQLVPEATIAVAHGQMNESELESVMRRFASGEIDVLVTTSIIEAGLDIPNANTLIVDRADWFGLAQLYQLRGRVGRSASRAFAYFFHPAWSQLRPDAQARLETIAEHTELGAGFNIAMRDLELRGAGDILGVRQSGQISAVGFHLYTQMLAQAVRTLKQRREAGLPIDAETMEPLALSQATVTIDLPLPTYIPTDYVPDMSLRIQLYRRMGELRGEATVEDLAAELEDRFGPLPPPVENLVYQLRVKQLALEAGVDGVTVEGDQISIRMSGLAHIDRRALQSRLGHDTRVSRPAIWLPIQDGWEQALVNVLSQIAAEELGVAA